MLLEFIRIYFCLNGWNYRRKQHCTQHFNTMASWLIAANNGYFLCCYSAHLSSFSSGLSNSFFLCRYHFLAGNIYTFIDTNSVLSGILMAWILPSVK